MTLDALIMLAGALVAIVPLMEGLPDAWQRLILVLLGIFVIALGIVVRRRSYGHVQKESAKNEQLSPAPHAAPVIEAREETVPYISQIPEIVDEVPGYAAMSDVQFEPVPVQEMESTPIPEPEPEPERQPEIIAPEMSETEPKPITPTPAPAPKARKKRAPTKRTAKSAIKPRTRRTIKKTKVAESSALPASDTTYEYSTSHEEEVI